MASVELIRPRTNPSLFFSGRGPQVALQELEPDSTMDGAALMDESEEAELTEEQTWEVVKDFIVGDHTPPPAGP